MKKGVLILIILLAIIVIAGLIVSFDGNTSENSGVSSDSGDSNTESGSNTEGTGSAEPENHVIEITSSGFTPGTLAVKRGDSVTFLNKDSSPRWPASAMHPTHRVYPGSDIEKCGTSEESSIFDACRGLAEGESYSFVFDEAGSWNYHDHLNLGMFGKIIVE